MVISRSTKDRHGSYAPKRKLRIEDRGWKIPYCDPRSSILDLLQCACDKARKAMHVAPVPLHIIPARLAGIVQEMQTSLFRPGYSTIIRESQDASCAILNPAGEVVAQHVVLPLHMGAFPACAAAVLK